ncbi:MAG: hypothetical protein EA400_04210 [Chromatiaceae bacterium]|nr:MAG: hypothetical protein EA400_04210 [Chromatiaceae bacterium]
MDSSSIQLAGSEIAGVSYADGTLRVHFSRASIIRTMTGSTERTRWWQAGDLVMEDAELEAPLPVAGPLVCAGGDIEENVYVYRDMIPIPLSSRGHCRCDLHLRDDAGRICASAATVRLELQATPKYIEHLRD